MELNLYVNLLPKLNSMNNWTPPLAIFILSITILIPNSHSAEGDLLWSYLADGGIRSTVTEDTEGRIFFGTRVTQSNGSSNTYDGTLYCFDPSAGNFNAAAPAPLWQFSGSTDWIDSTAAIGINGVVYFTSWDDNIYALNATNGALINSYQTVGWIFSSPCVGPDNRVYVASSDGLVYCLDSTLTTLNWLHPIGSTVDASPCLSSDGTLYLCDNAGYAYAFDTLTTDDNSRVKWEFQVDEILVPEELNSKIRSSPTVDDSDNIYFGSRNHIFYGIDASGVPFLQESASIGGIDLGEVINGSAVIDSQGRIYIFSGNGVLHVLDSMGVSLYQIILGDADMSTPVIADDNTVYAITYASGTGVDVISEVWSLNIDSLSAPYGQIDPSNPNHSSIEQSIEKIITNLEGVVTASPFIASDGSLYIATEEGYLYAFETGKNPSTTGWPQFRRNDRHSGYFNLQPSPQSGLTPAIFAQENVVLTIQADLAVATGNAWSINNAFTGDTNAFLQIQNPSVNDVGTYNHYLDNGAIQTSVSSSPLILLSDAFINENFTFSETMPTAYTANATPQIAIGSPDNFVDATSYTTSSSAGNTTYTWAEDTGLETKVFFRIAYQTD